MGICLKLNSFKMQQTILLCRVDYILVIQFGGSHGAVASMKQLPFRYFDEPSPEGLDWTARRLLSDWFRRIISFHHVTIRTGIASLV